MTNATAPKLTQAERLAKMAAGRAKAGAAIRAMRGDVLSNQESFINSPEFRARHKTNSVVRRAYDDLRSLQEKYKVNLDGTPMTIEQEIAARNAAGVALSDRQRKHLGMPTKAEEKAAAEAAELEEDDDQDAEAA